MARVHVHFKASPEDPLEGYDETVRNLKKMGENMGFKVVDTREEELAYGIKILHILITVEEDSEGLMESVERAITNLEGVGSLEVMGVTRA